MVYMLGGWQEASLQKSPWLLGQHHGWLTWQSLNRLCTGHGSVPPSCTSGVYPNPPRVHVGNTVHGPPPLLLFGPHTEEDLTLSSPEELGCAWHWQDTI